MVTIMQIIRRNIRLLSLVLFSFLLCIVFFRNSMNPTSKDLEYLSHYRRCLLDESLKVDNLWQFFAIKVLSVCAKRFEKITEVIKRIKTVRNFTDKKYVLLPVGEESKQKCIAVTLGIGADIEAEKKLRKLRPECVFYGADAVYGTAEAFSEIGTFFVRAISGATAPADITVIRGWMFSKEKAQGTSLEDFLHNDVKQPIIDYLWMDIEGSEWSILSKFVDKNSLLPTVICQLTIEMHGPLEKGGHTVETYNQFFRDLLILSDFVPLVSTTPFEVHRAFWFNTQDKYCTQTYLN